MLSSACGLEQHLQDLGHSFFTIRTSQPANNIHVYLQAEKNSAFLPLTVVSLRFESAVALTFAPLTIARPFR